MKATYRFVNNIAKLLLVCFVNLLYFKYTLGITPAKGDDHLLLISLLLSLLLWLQLCHLIVLYECLSHYVYTITLCAHYDEKTEKCCGVLCSHKEHCMLHIQRWLQHFSCATMVNTHTDVIPHTISSESWAKKEISYVATLLHGTFVASSGAVVTVNGRFNFNLEWLVSLRHAHVMKHTICCDNVWHILMSQST